MQITQNGGKLTGEVEYIKYLGDTEFDYTVDLNGNFSEPEVEMLITGNGLSMSYTGTLSSDGKTIEGVFIDDFDIPDDITLARQ